MRGPAAHGAVPRRAGIKTAPWRIPGGPRPGARARCGVRAGLGPMRPASGRWGGLLCAPRETEWWQLWGRVDLSGVMICKDEVGDELGAENGLLDELGARVQLGFA